MSGFCFDSHGAPDFTPLSAEARVAAGVLPRDGETARQAAHRAGRLVIGSDDEPDTLSPCHPGGAGVAARATAAAALACALLRAAVLPDLAEIRDVDEAVRMTAEHRLRGVLRAIERAALAAPEVQDYLDRVEAEAASVAVWAAERERAAVAERERAAAGA